MSDDWQVGDLAVCEVVGPIHTPSSCIHNGVGCPPKGSINRVIAIEPSLVSYPGGPEFPCGCSTLRLDDGTCGIVRRFRKIRPDEREACEPEFVILLKRSKRQVPA